MAQLGRLERVNLRNIWRTEAQDFTPWLAQEDNLTLLGEALQIELELEAVEQNVGPFRADILCKDTLTNNWVLVENQLERTDHTHLGQLITYAAGLDAATIVWIAAQVANEHRAAIDWLNDITDTDFRFFAIEVELWRIGESSVAPKFNLVSFPNDWSRSTSAARKNVADSALSETQQLQREYWEAAEALLQDRHRVLKPLKPPPQHWISHSIGKSGVLIMMAMTTRDNLLRTEIYLGGKWAKSWFEQLVAQKQKIELEFGGELDWLPLPGKQDARISIAMQADPRDRNDWPRQHVWLVNNLIKLHDVFRPYIAKLEDRQATGVYDE